MGLIILILLTLVSCGNQNSTLTFDPKQPKQITAEEKKKILKGLGNAITQKDYATFADVLAEVYKNGWQGDEDFKRAESYLYMKRTFDHLRGKYEENLTIGNIIFKKVYESWRFKYLKIISLEKLGNLALEKGDLDMAENYAKQVTSIEYRPEGLNLLARIYIKRAEDALKAGDKTKAKSILLQSDGMEITADLRKKIDEMLKKLE